MEREIWHDSYLEELKELYFLVYEIVNDNYNLNNINHETAFHNFSRLAFNDSSKYISEYTKSNCPNENLNEY